MDPIQGTEFFAKILVFAATAFDQIFDRPGSRFVPIPTLLFVEFGLVSSGETFFGSSRIVPHRPELEQGRGYPRCDG